MIIVYGFWLRIIAKTKDFSTNHCVMIAVIETVRILKEILLSKKRLKSRNRGNELIFSHEN